MLGRCFFAAVLICAAPVLAQTNATVDQSDSTRELEAVKRVAGAKPVVAIYEFRSAVVDVQPGAAREMFVTALIKSGVFAVAERTRLNEGIMRERQLQSSGVTTGSAGGQIAGARYVFEVVISESNKGQRESGQSVNLGGLKIGGGSSADAIGVDVRVVDVQSGLVVDAVNSVKEIEASTTQISGLGTLLGSFNRLRGKIPSGGVDAESKSSRKEGVERALRACMEVAVAELARRIVTN